MSNKVAGEPLSGKRRSFKVVSNSSDWTRRGGQKRGKASVPLSHAIRAGSKSTALIFRVISRRRVWLASTPTLPPETRSPPLARPRSSTWPAQLARPPRTKRRSLQRHRPSRARQRPRSASDPPPPETNPTSLPRSSPAPTMLSRRRTSKTWRRSLLRRQSQSCRAAGTSHSSQRMRRKSSMCSRCTREGLSSRVV